MCQIIMMQDCMEELAPHGIQIGNFKPNTRLEGYSTLIHHHHTNELPTGGGNYIYVQERRLIPRSAKL